MSIKHNGLIENGEETLSNAIYKDYKGDEQKIKFEFGRSSILFASSAEKPPPLEVEITPQNLQSIINIMNKTATKPRDTDDNKQTTESMLGELVDGLRAIAKNSKSNIASL